MIATLNCCRCSRADAIEVHTIFDFEAQATALGWVIVTVGLSGGRVESYDVCPNCNFEREAEVPDGAAGSPSDPGAGGLRSFPPRAESGTAPAFPTFNGCVDRTQDCGLAADSRLAAHLNEGARLAGRAESEEIL